MVAAAVPQVPVAAGGALFVEEDVGRGAAAGDGSLFVEEVEGAPHPQV